MGGTPNVAQDIHFFAWGNALLATRNTYMDSTIHFGELIDTLYALMVLLVMTKWARECITHGYWAIIQFPKCQKHAQLDRAQ